VQIQALTRLLPGYPAEVRGICRGYSVC